MKTLMAKEVNSKTADLKIGDREFNRKWYIVDAEGIALGRLASQVATVLRGKNKPEYTPNTDAGDFVIVINSDKVLLTGKKRDQKIRTHYTGYMGSLKEEKYSSFMLRASDQAVYEAVKGMLPKNALGRKMIKKLRVYKGAEHKHEAQQPEPFKLVTRY